MILKLVEFFPPLKYRAISAEKVAMAMIEVAKSNSEGILLLESDQIHKLVKN